MTDTCLWKRATAQVVKTSVTYTEESTVLVSTPVTQMIIFNQGMLLQGSNHFLKIIIVAVVFLFRGFLKADKSLGQVPIKLSAFDNKCEIHECFDVSVSIQMAF